ncbi:hypothetical protein P4501_04530 [Bacillus thuringiensis]|nr:hypothetical protein [Bacillus thuringiensis]
MKKIAVAKLKVTLKLEGILPAFLCWFAYTGTTIKRSYPTATSFPYTPLRIHLNISTIFQIYRSFLHLYQRFFHYINDSAQDIDLTTTLDIQNVQHTLSPKQLTAELYD